MPSAVEICNLALLKFGEITISAIDTTTNQGRALTVFYPLLRQQLIYSYQWNFALTRADISAQVATTPAFGWDYAYTLPSDCLRVVEFYGQDVEYEIENGQLLTDSDEEIYIRYLKDVSTTGEFSPSFVDCLATLIGAELSAKLQGGSKGQSMRNQLLQELLQIKIPKAIRLNEIEGQRPERTHEKTLTAENFSWQTQGR